jgi:uncharacterized membrane protein required for colicin V production
MIDLLALTFLGLFGYLGWRRGTILTALSAGGLVLGYLGAVLFYRPVGRLLESALGVPPILAFPLGGLGALLLTSILVKIVTVRISANRRWRVDRGFMPSTRDRAGGAALGVVWALGIVIVLAWGLSRVRGRMRKTASPDGWPPPLWARPCMPWPAEQRGTACWHPPWRS